MPVTGSIGGAKGVGSSAQPLNAAVGIKRSREEFSKTTNALSSSEQEAIAKREAARARVQQRTMSNFGLT